MARPLGFKPDALTRERIRTSLLVNRLQNSVLVNDDNQQLQPLDAVQLNTIKILLAKSLPDIKIVEIEVNEPIKVEVIMVKPAVKKVAHRKPASK